MKKFKETHQVLETDSRAPAQRPIGWRRAAVGSDAAGSVQWRCAHPEICTPGPPAYAPPPRPAGSSRGSPASSAWVYWECSDWGSLHLCGRGKCTLTYIYIYIYIYSYSYSYICNLCSIIIISQCAIIYENALYYMPLKLKLLGQKYPEWVVTNVINEWLKHAFTTTYWQF